MKFIPLLILLISCSTRADFVYMRETKTQKTIQFLGHHGEAQTINDISRKEWAIYPDITPDGNEIVYSEGSDQSDLHLTYLNRKTMLTQRFHPLNKGMVLHPKFTKNTRLIFYTAPGANNKNTIFFFDRAELVKRQGERKGDFILDSATALDEADESYFPRPSADGSFVIYQRNMAGKKEIISYDRIENEKTVIAEGMSPTLSFDERTIAFTAKKEGSWNIYLYNRQTKVITQATNDAGSEMAPTFMPDNSLVFASDKTEHFRLYKLENNQWVSILPDTQSETWDAYSPQFSGDTHLTQSELSPYEGNPRSSFGTVVHQGKVYMCGGHQGAEHTYPPESFSDKFFVFEIATNSWRELAPRPFLAHGYQIAAFGNYIYAFGGFTYSADHLPKWKSTDQIDRYDIEKNEWKTIGKLNSPRSSNVAVTIDNKVILAAGWNATPKFKNDYDGTFLDTVEIFDLETEQLKLADYKLPMPLRRALTGVDYQGKVLMVGGLGVGASHFELLQNVTSFDPQTGVSTELKPLPFATFAPAAETLNDKLYVFGGMFKTGEMNYEYVAHIYEMNLKSEAWRHTGRFLKETKGFSQVFKLNNSTLGILGGHRYFEGFDSPVTTFETFK